MGWISNDQLHEGYLAVVLADGAITSTSNATGPVVMLTDDQGNGTGADVQRTDDEIIGWRLCCTCSIPTKSCPVSTWTGDNWHRVATAVLEDVEAGRIYIPTDEVAADVMYREDVQTVARARWLAEHVSPLEALEVIRTSRAEITAETLRLEQAVTYARAAGQTWEKIGQAAGMTRQSAQERWGHARD